MLTKEYVQTELRGVEASLVFWQGQFEEHKDEAAYRCYTRQLATACYTYGYMARLAGMMKWDDLAPVWSERNSVLYSKLDEVDSAWLDKKYGPTPTTGS